MLLKSATFVVLAGLCLVTAARADGIDMVWAEIAVAALAGSLLYGIVALIERWMTFWHPSQRH